jgi:hypothetical protein
MTQSEIEPAAFRLIAQCLNQSETYISINDFNSIFCCSSTICSVCVFVRSLRLNYITQWICKTEIQNKIIPVLTTGRNSYASSYPNIIGYSLSYPEASNNTAVASCDKPHQRCTGGMKVRLKAFLALALNGGLWEDSRSGYFVSGNSTYPSRRNLHVLHNGSGWCDEQHNPWSAKCRNPQLVVRHLLTLTNGISSANSFL